MVVAQAPRPGTFGNKNRRRVVSTNEGHRGEPLDEAIRLTRFHTKRARKEFEEAAYSLAPKLYRLAYARLGHVQDAEDVVQETYVKAFKSLDSYQPGTNIEAWLAHILVNTIRDHLRHVQKLAPTEPLDENVELSNGQATRGPEEQLVEREIDAHVLSVLRTTPEWLLTPFLLREIHDMSYKQLAEALGVPIGTVMSRLSRARQYLRGRLEMLSDRAGVPQPDQQKSKMHLVNEDEQL